MVTLQDHSQTSRSYPLDGSARSSANAASKQAGKVCLIIASIGICLLGRPLHLDRNGFGLGCGADEGVQELEALGREAVPQLLDMVKDRLVALGFQGRELRGDSRRQGVRS